MLKKREEKREARLLNSRTIFQQQQSRDCTFKPETRTSDTALRRYWSRGSEVTNVIRTRIFIVHFKQFRFASKSKGVLPGTKVGQSFEPDE